MLCLREVIYEAIPFSLIYYNDFSLYTNWHMKYHFSFIKDVVTQMMSLVVVALKHETDKGETRKMSKERLVTFFVCVLLATRNLKRHALSFLMFVHSLNTTKKKHICLTLPCENDVFTRWRTKKKQHNPIKHTIELPFLPVYYMNH